MAEEKATAEVEEITNAQQEVKQENPKQDPKEFLENFDWDMFDEEDDEVLECGLENPDICESCQ